jgi:hypothetical protein
MRAAWNGLRCGDNYRLGDGIYRHNGTMDALIVAAPAIASWRTNGVGNEATEETLTRERRSCQGRGGARSARDRCVAPGWGILAVITRRSAALVLLAAGIGVQCAFRLANGARCSVGGSQRGPGRSLAVRKVGLHAHPAG